MASKPVQRESIASLAKATVAESVDVADLKSVARKGVPVRVRPVALCIGSFCVRFFLNACFCLVVPLSIDSMA